MPPLAYRVAPHPAQGLRSRFIGVIVPARNQQETI